MSEFEEEEDLEDWTDTSWAEPGCKLDRKCIASSSVSVPRGQTCSLVDSGRTATSIGHEASEKPEKGLLI